MIKQLFLILLITVCYNLIFLFFLGCFAKIKVIKNKLKKILLTVKYKLKKIIFNIKNNIFYSSELLIYLSWIVFLILSIVGIKLDSDNEKYFSSDSLYSCYIAIFIGSITLFFTVFAFNKPKKMSFKYYEKYVINIKTKLLYLFTGVIFTGNTTIVFFNPYNLFFRLTIVISIFLILILLIQSICEMNAMENKEIASNIFVTSVCKKIIKNRNKKQNIDNYSQEIFKNYLLPCFNENSFNVAYQNYELIIDKYYGTFDEQKKSELLLEFTRLSIITFKEFDNTYSNQIMKKYKKCNQIIFVMDRIVESNLKFILKNYKIEDPNYFDKIISIAYSLYEIWFNLYKKLIYENYDNIKYSMILKGAEPLKLGILLIQKQNRNIPIEYESLYIMFMNKSYELCIIILYQKDFQIFRNFVQDYINSIQFLNMYESCNEILVYHNHNLILIATNIANLYQEKRINQDYLNLLLFIFNETKYITIGFDAVLYSEPLSFSNIHEVEKTTHYYFNLAIIYTLSLIKKDNKKKEFLENLIYKIDNSNNEKNIFDILFDKLEKMPDIENCNQRDVYILKEELENKINNRKQEEFEVLKKLVENNISKKLPILLKRDIKEFNNHFSYCSIYKDENYTPIMLPKGFRFSHSAEYIANVSDYDIFGIYSHFNIIDIFIFNQFINNATVINVNSIDEIINKYPNEEKLEIIASIKYHSYIYTLNNIKHDGDDFIYKDRRLHISFDRDISDYLIIKIELKNHIFLKPLVIDDDTKEEITIDEENRIIKIYKEYKPEFFINTNSEIKIYSIIGVKENY